ncbi:hypothetical protein NTGBS_880041 [Candidatus Nitrotoga sp. BS]|nr:hypothetical protein NTGBS_880041 [Candidatus Nitrotoga sp. BS]
MLLSGALYHVTSSGNRFEDLHLNEDDCEERSQLLGHVSRVGWARLEPTRAAARCTCPCLTELK